MRLNQLQGRKRPIKYQQENAKTLGFFHLMALQGCASEMRGVFFLLVSFTMMKLTASLNDCSSVYTYFTDVVLKLFPKPVSIYFFPSL